MLFLFIFCYLVGSGHGNYTLVHVYTETTCLPNTGLFELRYFEFQHSKYFWNNDEGRFCPIERLIVQETLDEILENSHGCTDNERLNLYVVYYITLLQ